MKRSTTLAAIATFCASLLLTSCKTDGQTAAVPKLTCTSEATVNAAADGGDYSITYFIENPAEKGTISADAADNCDWIENFDTSGPGTVTFTVQGNSDMGPRKGGMEVTYSYPGGEPQSFEIEVIQEGSADAESVTLNTQELKLAVGETARLSAAVIPEDMSGYVVWSSDNPDAATVDSEGTVTATGPGQATITAKVGSASDFCEVTVSETLSNHTIYAAGYYDKTMYSFFWKTGDMNTTMLADETMSTRAHTIYVSGSDVYIGGEATAGDYGYLSATVWKNGEAAYLTDTDQPIDAAVYSITEHNGDIYASGFYRVARTETTEFRRDAAMVWKNGEAFELTDGTNYAQARSIAVADNGTVYAIGESSDENGIAAATLWSSASGTWEDKVTRSLSSGPNHAYAQSVCVADGDVYVAGYGYDTEDYYVAMLWKNDEPVQLISDGAYSYAYSVFAADGHVYVAGWEYKNYDGSNCAVATLWIDGEAQYLDTEKRSSQARCVFVKDGEVYVSGFIGDQAVIWFNGTPKALTDGSVSAAVTSIFVTD
ncbi:MAG TPA: Ig-like domain-containing protein [Candidatus Coprenecus pullistercoris]|nr:Ig-like domain-containing protein [Candidatus Coprenecus pullistercoris]